MTEAGWLVCADPEPMLRSLSRRPRRKTPGGPGLDPERFRAFAAACCRRVWAHLTDYLRVVLEHLERYPHQAAPDTLTLAGQIYRAEAEGLGSRWALEMARILHGPADYRQLMAIDVQRCAAAAVGQAAEPQPYQAAKAHLWAARSVGLAEVLDSYPPGQRVPNVNSAWDRVSTRELRAQAGVLRDVFGNPFRPAAFDPPWRTPTVLALGRAAHEERTLPSGELDPARLAVLADALEEAGADAAVLAHLHGPGPHVRGCWAVDLATGRW
jgi:hypothetical protein